MSKINILKMKCDGELSSDENTEEMKRVCMCIELI